MKRALALTLVIVFFTTFLFPAYGFAQYDKELKQAINTAKSILDISDGYDNFDYNMNKRDDRTVFELRWSDSNNKLGNINVSIDSEGRIINYHRYKPRPGNEKSGFPVLSREEAVKKGDAFIKKVNSVPFEKIMYQKEERPVNLQDTNYYLNYVRVENGIPYLGNHINVTVNNVTGEVQNYSCYWNYSLKFPDIDGVISQEEARGIFTDKLGLKPVYKFRQGPMREVDELKPYLVYTNVYNNRSIDARTGEIITPESYYGIYAGDGMGEQARKAASDYGMDNQGSSLTPKEREAVENAAGIMSAAKAEETARKVLDIGREYQVNNINLYKSWLNRKEYSWNIYFTQESKVNGDIVHLGYSVTLNAKSGELLNFHISKLNDKDLEPEYDISSSREIAEAFIKKLQPERFKEVEITDWTQSTYEPIETKEKPRQYYFSYQRKANNAYFLENGFNVTVDGVSGSVISYNFNWYKGELPGTEGMITETEANEILFAEIGLQLQYTPYQEPNTVDKVLPPVPPETREKNVKPVYAVKQGKPINIDPFTGVLIDYNGEPYVEPGVIQYTDISGHYAESKIKTLASYGISLPGENFEPRSIITQRDFLYLLEKTINSYYPYKPDKEHDKNLYETLINRGILKEGEKAPQAYVSRQDAVKFVIRALNYNKIAEIDKGIFAVPFKDAGRIDSNLYGYVAIAYGLNIIQGSDGYFNPMGNLTRGQAAVVIYNFLDAR